MRASHGKLLFALITIAPAIYAAGSHALGALPGVPSTGGVNAAASGPLPSAGGRLSFDFQDIPVRAALQLLAEAGGRNLVVSSAVGGNLTLRLHDVSWNEALSIVLRTEGLVMRRSGDVILIGPAAEFASRERQRQQAQNRVRSLAPLGNAYLQVNYAKAGDLATLIRSQKGSLLSPRGTVASDARTNTLIVHDTADHIAQVRELVRTLDVPVRQVLIDSRVVITASNYQRDLGVRFGVTGVHQGPHGTIATTGSLAGTDQMLAGQLGEAPPAGPYPVPDLNNRLNVNVPVATPAGRFAVAILGGDFLVDLELSALQAEGRGEVISSPRVITADKQTAIIEQGVEIPYENASSSGATAVQFKKAVLSLKVTPQITPDDQILMNIEVHKDSVGQSVPTANGGSVPSIDTRDVTTEVLVDNGDTVVLGGIYEVTRAEAVSKVPFLGDIPVLGALFRHTHKTREKDELLIFVTPKLLTTSLAGR